MELDINVERQVCKPLSEICKEDLPAIAKAKRQLNKLISEKYSASAKYQVILPFFFIIIVILLPLIAFLVYLFLYFPLHIKLNFRKECEIKLSELLNVVKAKCLICNDICIILGIMYIFVLHIYAYAKK